MVERHLAKVNVASSNLVFRSIYYKTKTQNMRLLLFVSGHSQAVRQRSAKPLCTSSNLGGLNKEDAAA